MGFWTGRVTYTRYQVGGHSPIPFSEEVLAAAQQHLIGHHGAPDPTDGVTCGWAGGEHVLDLVLEPAKNIVEDALHLAIRIDTDKIPGSLLAAYTRIELDARAKANPSGFATKNQRQEAKEAALERARAEAADGRFRRLSHYPVLWDARTATLYAGSTRASVLERLQSLFRETFDRTLEPVTAGSLAIRAGGESCTFASGQPGGMLGVVGENSDGSSAVAWSADDANRPDFLGNEFLVWIWHTLQNDGGTVLLADGSEASVTLAKTLTLDCPRGETGRDHLTDETPTRLPEALRALQAGKLPRKAGMILERHRTVYELTLQAETLAVSGASLPTPDEPGRSELETRLARLESLRHLTETLDLLFATFVARRTSTAWSDELGRIRQWLTAA